jgi:hypothetical protein
MIDVDILRALPPAELAHWIRKNPQEAKNVREAIYWNRVKLARQDPNEFCELVMRDEERGTAIVQAPIHEEFQRSALQNDRLIIWGHVESGKTAQLSIAHTLHEIGQNPRLRCVVGSATTKYASRIVGACRRIIEQPGPIHDVFPNLRPGPVWSATALAVDIPGIKGMPKDPTIQATSVGTASLIGARTDRFIGDDLINQSNTATPAQRQDVHDWYFGVPMSRLTPDAKVRLLGNAFHPEDLLHELAEGGEYVWKKYPVVDAQGNSTWPERWPIARIEKKRREVLPHEFARMMLCIPRDENQARFRSEWITQCLVRGDGLQPAYALNAVPHGYRVFTGVDLGVRAKHGADLTVLFTIIVHPNEDREVLWVESGRWAAKDIVDRIVDTHRRYNSIVIVENNAAQQFIVDFTKSSSAVPVRPFFTGKNKTNPEFGVESLATEMANGKWIIPSLNGKPAGAEIGAWVTDMLYYDPAAHTGDRLMASWFAREASRLPPKAKVIQRRIDTLNRGGG